MTDDREAIDSASMGQIMSLVLDAADPRRSANERDDGAEAAGAISETAAFVVAVGYLRAVLDAIQRNPELGEAAAESIMKGLASVSMGALGIFIEEGE